ncbi:MAG: biotin-dependent carboxyltransferase family protein [Ginsengibacter sp.]
MSLQIIKSGLSDTLQDQGRYGYQHLGINPGGAMDRYSARLANALLGKDINSPVIEIHFPSPVILFNKESIICITGADFSPTINQKKIRINQLTAINEKSVLQFEKNLSGARCYLACLHDPDIDKWLNSYSTNLIAAAGGFNGRALKKGDILNFKNTFEYKYLQHEKDFSVLPWKAIPSIKSTKEIRFIKGNEWDWLTGDSINIFEEKSYMILNNSNRMGYRLKGNSLKVNEEVQLISSGVTFGTIQLLPDGQLIVLMADHQTTGGYPRIGHVISADLPSLAQRNPGDEIKFSAVEHVVAEQELIEQHMHLLQLQTASKFKLEKLLNVTL